MATPITLGKVATAVFKYTDSESGAKKVVQFFAKAIEWMGLATGRDADSLTSLYKPAKKFTAFCSVLELGPKGLTLIGKGADMASEPSAWTVTDTVAAAGDLSGSFFPTVELCVEHGVVAISKTANSLIKPVNNVFLGVGMVALAALQARGIDKALDNRQALATGSVLPSSTMTKNQAIAVESNKIVVAMMKIAMAVSNIAVAVIGILGFLIGLSVSPVITTVLGTSVLVSSVAAHFWETIFVK